MTRGPGAAQSSGNRERAGGAHGTARHINADARRGDPRCPIHGPIRSWPDSTIQQIRYDHETLRFTVTYYRDWNIVSCIEIMVHTSSRRSVDVKNELCDVLYCSAMD